MIPRLADAYAALLAFEELGGFVHSNRASVLEEIADSNESIRVDLEKFNAEVERLVENLQKPEIDRLKGDLIRVRIFAMNLASEFSDLADEIQTAFVESPK